VYNYILNISFVKVRITYFLFTGCIFLFILHAEHIFSKTYILKL
jgi:hypothetical protein